MSTTIPNYPVSEDVLRFNPDGTIEYEFAGPNEKKYGIRYRTKIDGDYVIFYPENGTDLIRRNGYRIRICEIATRRISLILDGRETIYEKEN